MNICVKQKKQLIQKFPTSALKLEVDTERVLSCSMFRKEETLEYNEELSREMILQIELWRIAENTTCIKEFVLGLEWNLYEFKHRQIFILV